MGGGRHGACARGGPACGGGTHPASSVDAGSPARPVAPAPDTRVEDEPMKLIRLKPLLLAAALAACDSGGGGTDPDDLAFGRFDGSLNGDVSTGIDGQAFSYNTPNFGQDEILLVDNTERVVVDIWHSTSDFTAGTESINDWLADDDGLLAVVYLETGNRYFVSVDGTLRITDIDADGVTGEAEFLAVEVDPDTQEELGNEITVDAAFRTRYDGEVTGALRATSIRATIRR